MYGLLVYAYKTLEYISIETQINNVFANGIPEITITYKDIKIPKHKSHKQMENILFKY